MTVESARGRRKDAWDSMLFVWAVALIPNFLDAVGVGFVDDGWFVAIRVVLAVLWIASVLYLLFWAWKAWRLGRPAAA